MLDSAALQQLVEQQIQKEVTDRVTATLTQEWADRVEGNAVKFIQDRIVAKFANSEAMPELIAAVKSSVKELFVSGHIPGLGQYVDYDYIKKSVDDSTQSLVQQAIAELTIDPAWLEKIENSVNQIAGQRVLAKLSGTDIRPMVQQYVDSVVKSLNTNIFKGIESQSNKVELTILDDHVVVEKQFTAKDIEAVDSLTVKNLIVKGTVNTDNRSWNELSDTIGEKAFEKISDAWRESLIQQVRDSITQQGVDFKNIKVNGELLVDNDKLSSGITQSQLQSVGKLKSLTVVGDTSLSGTVNVSKNRVGINTDTPEMALSLWDEEVAVVAGKFKSNVGYIGTARKQGLVVGINKNPVVEIDEDGLTAIKQLQVGIHRISHANEVPGYAGTKGDIVFNATPTVDSPVFAWQCLGGYRWKVIKAVE
jgi:hypothetical protein